ncbi:hypothetical protein MRX96_003781 [Rhipicephalus microplus]
MYVGEGCDRGAGGSADGTAARDARAPHQAEHLRLSAARNETPRASPARQATRRAPLHRRAASLGHARRSEHVVASPSPGGSGVSAARGEFIRHARPIRLGASRYRGHFLLAESRCPPIFGHGDSVQGTVSWNENCWKYKGNGRKEKMD